MFPRASAGSTRLANYPTAQRLQVPVSSITSEWCLSVTWAYCATMGCAQI
jgi:hypothetical protein